MKCPLCDSRHIQYRTAPICDPVHMQTKTHAWICEDCPFVGFEYYLECDYRALGQILDIRVSRRS